MVIKSAKEIHEEWRKRILAQYLEDIPVEKEFEIALQINKAIHNGMPDTIYDKVWEGEVHNGKRLYESITRYLEAMGYTVDCHKSTITDRMNIHIRWDRPKEMAI